MDCFKIPHRFGDIFYVDMHPEGYHDIGSIGFLPAQFELDTAGTPRELQRRYEHHSCRMEGHETKK